MDPQSGTKVIEKKLIAKGITICKGGNIEESCSEYDYAKYYKFVFHYIPRYLRQLKDAYNFYVVGGIAIDAHLGRHFLGSPDWDIQVVGGIENLINFVHDLIKLLELDVHGVICAQAVASEEPNEEGHLVFKKNVIQIATISKDGCLLLPLDISIGPSAKKTEIDGIDYLNAEELYYEVERMLGVRKRGLEMERKMVYNCKDGMKLTFGSQLRTLKSAIKESYGRDALGKFVDDREDPTNKYRGKAGFELYVTECFNKIEDAKKQCLENEAFLLKKEQKLAQTELRVVELRKALAQNF